jgi:hypothetical protein
MNDLKNEDRILEELNPPMSETEIELRAQIVLLTTDLNEYKSALVKFKKTGRPITLPANLTPQEFNHMLKYMQKQQNSINREINRQKKTKK